MNYTFSDSIKTYAGVEITLKALKIAAEKNDSQSVELYYSSIFFTSSIILDLLEAKNNEFTEAEWEIFKADFKYFEEEAFRVYSAYKLKVA